MLQPPPFLTSLLSRPVVVVGSEPAAAGVTSLLSGLGVEVWRHDHLSAAAGDPAPGLAVLAAGADLDGQPERVASGRPSGWVVLRENDLAPLLWRGRLLVVTGTRGKTRLVRLLTEALHLAGKDVVGAERADGGLAGVVAARRGGAPDSILVSRMDAGESLALRHLRADAVIWTNLLEEEAARHGSMEAAFAAGWRMFERAVGGDVFAGETVQRWADHLGQTLPPDSRVATDDASGDVLLRHTLFEAEPAHETFLLAAAWWRAAGLRESVLYAAAQGAVAR